MFYMRFACYRIVLLLYLGFVVRLFLLVASLFADFSWVFITHYFCFRSCSLDFELLRFIVSTVGESGYLWFFVVFIGK